MDFSSSLMDQTFPRRKQSPSPWNNQGKPCPAIMQSIDNPSLILPNRDHSLDTSDRRQSNFSIPPDVTLTSGSGFQSMKLVSTEEHIMPNSFLLLDKEEILQVSSADAFLQRLHCPDPSTRVKVVSIFGNTGDGKSYTLNQTFFCGENVFCTSNEQDSCTLGVWAAFDPKLNVICLDTEGLLGSTRQKNQRTRLLLKVLAVSDIVIYRTRAERLHEDLFTFLGSASRAYTQHFQRALNAVSKRGEFSSSVSALGPAVIIFHETRNTLPLSAAHRRVFEVGGDLATDRRRTLLNGLYHRYGLIFIPDYEKNCHKRRENPEDLLRARFAELNLEIDAFSSVRYIGVQTVAPPTSFRELSAAVSAELENSTVRSRRSPQLVYNTLKVLNDKFSGKLDETRTPLFPDQYFTCPAVCLACDKRCDKSMGHLKDNQPHNHPAKCRFQHQFGNCVYICKICHINGKEVMVKLEYSSANETSWFGLAKYAWSGSVIECPNCGEIYRSRQFWFGNTPPEASAVRTEIRHVWPGSDCGSLSNQNSAQKVIDSVSYLYDGVVNVSAQPTKALTSFLADQIAPKYWRPNHEIKNCTACRKVFGASDTKHHCRACGEGVCDDCSTHSKPVPERGWGEYPVRVCDKCYKSEEDVSSESGSVHGNDDVEVRARKYGETTVNAVSSVMQYVLEYPKAVIKDTARPDYWVADVNVKECCVCAVSFAPPRLRHHHCRDCGQGVCPRCSMRRRAVPHRGWTEPARVCDTCAKKD